MKNWFLPDHYAHSCLEVEPEKLKEHGVRLCILDIDNTLVPSDSEEVGEEERCRNHSGRNFQQYSRKGTPYQPDPECRLYLLCPETAAPGIIQGTEAVSGIPAGMRYHRRSAHH